MRLTMNTLCAAAALALGSTAAHAGDYSYGFVLGLTGSVDSQQSDGFSVDAGGVPTFIDITNNALSDSGYLAGFSVNSAFDEKWSVGAEISYRYNNFDATGQIDATRSGVTESLAATADSHVASLAALVNVRRYSGSADSNGRLFFEGGLGLSRSTSLSRLRATGELHGFDIQNTTEWDLNELGFAWQVGAGWEFAAGENSRASLAYRYFDSGQVNGLATTAHGVVLGLSF